MGSRTNVTGSYTETNVDTIVVEPNDTANDQVTATFRDVGNAARCLDEAALRRVRRACGAATVARGVPLSDSNANTLEATITDKAGHSTTYPVPPATRTTARLRLAWTKATCCLRQSGRRFRAAGAVCGDAHYVYAPTGERIEIQYGQVTLSGEDFSSFSSSSSRGFVCLGGNVIEEWTVSGGSLNTLAYRYVRNPATDLDGGIGSIMYQLDGADYRYYHYNHKGDVGALTEQDTDICAWYEYDGNTACCLDEAELRLAGRCRDVRGALVTEWEKSGVENEFRFSTKQWDDAPAGPADQGLIYFGARHYDPALARWTQLDPAGTVDGLNMYVYATSNPVNCVDADGTWHFEAPRWAEVFQDVHGGRMQAAQNNSSHGANPIRVNMGVTIQIGAEQRSLADACTHIKAFLKLVCDPGDKPTVTVTVKYMLTSHWDIISRRAGVVPTGGTQYYIHVFGATAPFPPGRPVSSHLAPGAHVVSGTVFGTGPCNPTCEPVEIYVNANLRSAGGTRGLKSTSMSIALGVTAEAH